MLHTFRRKSLKALNGVKNCLGNAATERRKQANINLCTFTHLYIYNYKYIYAHIHKKWHMAMRHSCQNNNNAQLTRRKYKNKKKTVTTIATYIHSHTYIYAAALAPLVILGTLAPCQLAKGPIPRRQHLWLYSTLILRRSVCVYMRYGLQTFWLLCLLAFLVAPNCMPHHLVCTNTYIHTSKYR